MSLPQASPFMSAIVPESHLIPVLSGGQEQLWTLATSRHDRWLEARRTS